MADNEMILSNKNNLNLPKQKINRRNFSNLKSGIFHQFKQKIDGVKIIY